MVGPQPTGPSPGLAEAVHHHAPGLHRTAVMLAGDSPAADRLVTGAFRQAPVTADHALLLHHLVRVFLRHPGTRLREELDPLAGRADTDAGDVLESLRPRERAATVLRRVEGWPASRTADALHVPRTAVAPLVSRAPGLEAALAAVADRHARPAAQVVGEVLAALGAQHDAAATSRAAGAAPRPWTWRALAGALALGLVVWVGVLADTSGDDRSATAEAETVGATLALVDGTTLPTEGTDLAARGWNLGPDGRPPDQVEGLRLVEAVAIDLERPHAPLRVDVRPRSGAAVFAVLWCDLPVIDPNLELPSMRIGMGGEPVTVPCAGMGQDPPVERLVPLPPGAGPGRTTALVSWTGDVPGRGRALLATYTEVGAGPGPSAGGRGAPPVAAPGSVVLDGVSPAYQVQDRPVHHRRVRIGPTSTITLWAGDVGAMAVQVDDVVVTDDGEVPPSGHAWRAADPELREGRWLVHGPGRARSFAVPEEVRPRDGETRVVTLAVTTTLDRRSWQVHVADAEVADEDRTPLPLADVGSDPGIPAWIGGHRLAAAWKVPNDGIPHALVDPGLRPGRRFLLVGTPAGTEPGAWGVVQPHVATTRGAAELTVVREVADAFDESVWRPGDHLLRAGASTRNIRAGTGTGLLAATAPAASGETPPSTLLAYEPVAFEDFDFGSAPPMAVSFPADHVADSPGAGASPADAVVVGRWTREDLDADGRLAVETHLAGRTWLRLTTAGEGRVRVLEDGRPALWLPDGWWTSWTAEPVVTELRVVGTQGAVTAPGQPLELLVEGYDAGFTVELLARDGRGGPPADT